MTILLYRIYGYDTPPLYNNEFIVQFHLDTSCSSVSDADCITIIMCFTYTRSAVYSVFKVYDK